MKCERCHNAEATKALSVELDGQPSTIFVCEECARKESASGSAGGAHDGDDNPVSGGMDVATKTPGLPSLADMLLDMAKMVSAAQKGGKPPVFEVHVRDSEGHELHASSEDGAKGPDAVPECPVCHMTLDELRDGRRFGCPQCYETFRDEVPTFTRELQFDDMHVGKAPARIVRETELHDLTLRFRKAVARQRFKEAKALSERIRELGGNPDSDTSGNPDEEDEAR